MGMLGRFVTYTPSDLSPLQEAIARNQVVFAYPDTLWQCRNLLDNQIAVVVDGYDLTLLEHLELNGGYARLEEHLAWQAQYQQINQFVLRRGDFFLCATERQRDWWLGALASAGRVNALSRAQSPSFRGLVDLLPYGIPEQQPTATHAVMRGVLPGIAPDDKIVLWGGGVWQWLDPLTLIRAAALLIPERPDVKFVFPGVHHPAGDLVSKMERQREALDLAHNLGLLDRSVFMGKWVAYADWQNYLLESDVGVSLHHDHLEAHMSARTRVLSYVWAGLPMVLTRGDELAERMAVAGVAQLVDDGDAANVAAAIMRMIDMPKGSLSETFDALRPAFRWGNAIRALHSFCEHPRRAWDADIPMTNPPPPMTSTPLNADELQWHDESAAAVSMHDTLATPPLLHLPIPATTLSRAIAPLAKSLYLWYLAAIVEQQNRINQMLQAQCESLQNGFTHLAEETSVLQAYMAGVVQQIAQLQLQTQELVIGQRALAAEKDELRTHLQGLAAEKDELHGSMRALAAQKDELYGSVRALAAQKDELQVGIKALAGEKVSMQQRLTRLQEEVSKLQIAYGQIAAETQRLAHLTDLLNLRLGAVEALQSDTVIATARDQLDKTST
jgi:glycosyltransferase involved in cell wall biosynthesis